MKTAKDYFGPWTEENSQKLAIFTGRSSKAFKKADFVQLKSDKGWYIDSDGKVKSWQIEGLSQRDEELLFYGPWLSLSPLEKEFRPSEREFVLIRDLFCQLEVDHTKRFSLLHMTRLEGGGFFLLPCRVLETIIHSSELSLEPLLLPYHHPFFRGQDALSYGLALLQFQIATGALPWISTDQEAVEFEIRNHRLPSLEKHIGGATAKLVDQCLNGMRSIPGLSDWKDKEILTDKSNTDELQQSIKKAKKRFQGIRFRHQNRIAIALGSLAAALLVTFGIFFTRSLLEPAHTAGLSQVEVIQGYYGEVNELDSPGSAEFCKGPGKRAHQRELDYLHVALRVSLGNMHEELTVSPQRWNEMGRAELNPNFVCYGISQLEIEAISDNRFRVQYIKWEVPQVEELVEYQPDLFSITEEIELNYRKKSWFIGEIQLIDREIMENPDLQNIETSLFR